MIKYFQNRNEADNNFRLVKNTTSQIHHAIKTLSKLSFAGYNLGIVIHSCRKWFELQMTPEMDWSNFEIDHDKPISSLDDSKDEETWEAFSWVKTQPLFKEIHQHKGTKFYFIDYKKQIFKVDQFIKLIEARNTY